LLNNCVIAALAVMVTRRKEGRTADVAVVFPVSGLIYYFTNQVDSVANVKKVLFSRH
jgi:hypothetical protein